MTWTVPGDVRDLLTDVATLLAPQRVPDRQGRVDVTHEPVDSGPALLTAAYQLPYERTVAQKTLSDISHFLFVGPAADVQPEYQVEVASVSGARFKVVGVPDITGQADTTYRSDLTPDVRVVLLLRVR